MNPDPTIIDGEAPVIESGPPPLGMMTQVESARAMHQIQAAMVMAKRYERDEKAAVTKILKACERYSLAERAFYSFPRGKGKPVTGASIRLAEVLVQKWGNCDAGIVELDRSEGRSLALSYCWDLETNVRISKTFEVLHAMKSGEQIKTLTDPRDVYEKIANEGTRRLRSCIFTVIPADVREDAEKMCKGTLAKGRDNEPLDQAVRRVLLAFERVGVSQEMIERRLDHKADLIDAEELFELTAIYNSIKDKQGKRVDYFELKDADAVEGEQPGSKAEELAAKLKKSGAPKE